MRWDIFCQVIDNYGDAGVCWRLTAELAARGHTVRLWMDDASILSWLAPQPLPAGIEVLSWRDAIERADALLEHALPDGLIEAFGCEIPQPYLHQLHQRWPQAAHSQPHWINLEYLSAEDYVQGMHGLYSPVMFGAATGWRKRFFFPGFTTATGGLLRERDLAARQQAFSAPAWRTQQLHAIGLTAASGSAVPTAALEGTADWSVLFSYESAAMPHWLAQLAAQAPNVLWVAAGRSQQAFLACYAAAHPHAPTPAHPSTRQWGNCLAILLPFLPQPAFDKCLWASDFSIVRGEDSLVRALWAGKPFIWHIYPQDDLAHHDKLNAFLDWAQAPACVRQAHHQWNGMSTAPDCTRAPAALYRKDDAHHWQAFAAQCRQRLLEQSDVVTQLLQSTGTENPS